MHDALTREVRARDEALGIAAHDRLAVRSGTPASMTGVLAASAWNELGSGGIDGNWALVGTQAIGAAAVSLWIAYRLRMRTPRATLIQAAAAVVMEGEELTLLDTQLSAWVFQHHHPWLTGVMFLITHWHSPMGVLLMSAALAIWMWRRRERYWLAALIVRTSP